jgi:gamma-glutamyltranspeptidase/glutathione hydrolase
MKGVVASGHPLTARAATEMLAAGGNAFDAVLSAGFASVVSEPTLTSLGGGGFLLAHAKRQKEDILFDFFVNTPGLNKVDNVKPAMKPVDIKFPQCTQVFHTGMASAAVPGMLKGLLHVHKRLCTLPLKTILSPALSYLAEGVEVYAVQEVILGYLEPILTSTDYGKEIYFKNGRYVRLGDRLFNPLLRKFFQDLSDNGRDIYSGETARRLIEEMAVYNGMITSDDLDSYDVIERKPLRIQYRDREVLTNPPPSSGGIMVALALHLLENVALDKIPRDSEALYITLIELMKEMNIFRPMKNGSTVSYPFDDSLLSPLIESYRHNVSAKTFIATQGTTHISVIDEEGNAASMTTSIGSGSGCFIPGTGIMLNNMMGEDDLHAEGFFSSPPNIRVSSMMIPTMVMKEGKVEFVLGSGGSKRIRSALLQVLVNVIDYNSSLKESVEKSRVHIEDGVVQAEPDIPRDVLENLQKYYRVNRWAGKNMYFGGVHCVNNQMDGWGDSRRGGSFKALT